jgi:hypothetical protein
VVARRSFAKKAAPRVKGAARERKSGGADGTRPGEEESQRLLGFRRSETWTGGSSPWRLGDHSEPQRTDDCWGCGARGPITPD